MKRILLGLFAILLTVGLGATAPAGAGEEPNILILGEDGDRNAVPRNNRVFKRVLDALANELDLEGFNVYDEAAVTLDGFDQGRVRRSDAEVVDIAQSAKNPPIDVAVIYAVYAITEETDYVLKIHTRVTGRLLDVRSGKRLGNFEVALPRADTAPTSCTRDCILETVGRNAKILAQDLGVVLAMKLDHLAPAQSAATAQGDNDPVGLSTAYSLVFSNFTPDEINRIEEYLVAFSGYRHHRPVTSSLRTNEYWYETDSQSARLNRNLRLMLDLMGAEGRVAFAGSIFTIEKFRERKERD